MIENAVKINPARVQEHLSAECFPVFQGQIGNPQTYSPWQERRLAALPEAMSMPERRRISQGDHEDLMMT